MSKTPQFKPARNRGIFLTGTDTHVGKTVLTAALGVALKKKGFRLGVMKPVETGIHLSRPELETDGSRLHKLLATDDPSDMVTPYQFSNPLAPLAASRKAQQPIDYALIKNRYQELSRNCDLLLVEGAGGVMVPLTEQQTVRDLIVYLELPCIVVSRPTLGSVNHTLLTLEALRDQKIQVLAIVLNQTTSALRSEVEKLQIESTSQLIREFSSVPVVGRIPFEPLLETDWEQGVRKLSHDPAITQLMTILEQSA
jgi:dethiobiotin synthetase